MPPRLNRDAARRRFQQYAERRGWYQVVENLPNPLRLHVYRRAAVQAASNRRMRRVAASYVSRLRDRIRSRNFQARAIARGINPNTRRPFRYSE